ncbi:MAG: hypothetical protein ACK56L_09970 [Pseudanabaena sp.]
MALSSPLTLFSHTTNSMTSASYGTNRNAELAKKLDMVECSKYCPSFRELVKFLRSL